MVKYLSILALCFWNITTTSQIPFDRNHTIMFGHLKLNKPNTTSFLSFRSKHHHHHHNGKTFRPIKVSKQQVSNQSNVPKKALLVQFKDEVSKQQVSNKSNVSKESLLVQFKDEVSQQQVYNQSNVSQELLQVQFKDEVSKQQVYNQSNVSQESLQVQFKDGLSKQQVSNQSTVSQESLQVQFKDEVSTSQNPIPNYTTKYPVTQLPVYHRKLNGSSYPSSRNNSNRYSLPATNPVRKYRLTKKNEEVDHGLENFFQVRPSHDLGKLWVPNSTMVLREEKTKNSTREIAFSISLALDLQDPKHDFGRTAYFPWELSRYDRACLQIEHIQRKAYALIPPVTEQVRQIVLSQNEHLSRTFLSWYFNEFPTPEALALGDKGTNHPQHRTFKFLSMTVRIFTEKICAKFSSYAADPRVRVPIGARRVAVDRLRWQVDFSLTDFIQNLFLLFIALRVHTIPEQVPDYPTVADEADILNGALTQCIDRGVSMEWFLNSCADTLLSQGSSSNYACTPLHDYTFNEKKYDPILDGMWFMINAVQAYCFNYFADIGIGKWHRYGIIMTNAFSPRMRVRWESTLATPRWYTRLLGSSKKSYYEAIERCMFSTVLVSEFPAIMPRFSSPKDAVNF